MRSSDHVKECSIRANELKATARFYSVLYTVSMFLAILIGIILLGYSADNELIRYAIGAAGLLFTVIPLFFKERIKKVQGYRELSSSFKNLEQDFSSRKTKRGIEELRDELKDLRTKQAIYPTPAIARFVAKRKFKKKFLKK